MERWTNRVRSDAISIRIVFTSEEEEISISRIEWIKDVYIVGIFFLYFPFFVISFSSRPFLINFETLFHDNGQESSVSSSLRELRPNLRKVRPVIKSTKRISSKFKAGPYAEGRENQRRERQRERERRGKANWKFQGMKLIATLRRNEVEGGRRKEWRATFFFFFSIFLFYRTLGTDQMQFLLKLLLPFACPLGTRTSVLGESIRNGRS